MIPVLVRGRELWQTNQMVSDLQLIDAFDQLREEYFRINAVAEANPFQVHSEQGIEQWVAEAWIQAIEGSAVGNGAPRRRVRKLALALLDPKRQNGIEEAKEKALLERGGDFRGYLKQARRERLWPVVEVTEVDAGPLVEGWGRILPGLTPLRAWRFVERLGWPIVVPESPARRFLWRLGLLEIDFHSPSAMLPSHSQFCRISRLTGIEPAVLKELVRWHTISNDRWDAGGRCASAPQCERCPFQAGCAWARYQAVLPEPANDRLVQRAIEPFRRRVVEGKIDQLDEAELLATILPAQVGGTGSYELAEQLLNRFGGLRGLERAAVGELIQIKGISRNRAVGIKASLELGRRLAAKALEAGDPVRSSDDIWAAYRNRFANMSQEYFLVVMLDAKNRVIQENIVSKGTLTGSMAHPREVFSEAIRQAAAGLILLHNHPSGDPTPSREDYQVTERLKEAGKILGIRVLDHIILGHNEFFSFRDHE